jgi:hypothetical protein
MLIFAGRKRRFFDLQLACSGAGCSSLAPRVCTSVTQAVTGWLHVIKRLGCNGGTLRLRLLEKNGFTFRGLDGCTSNENGLKTVDITIKERLFSE